MIAAAAGLGLAVGAVIGGLGGGGGILTVPVLVYLLGQAAPEATTSSVVIVGITALAGAAARVRGGIAWGTAAAFGALGIPAAHLGTRLNQHVAEPVLLLSFAGITLTAAAAMLLHGRRDEPGPGQADRHRPPARAPGASNLLAAPPAAPPHRRLATGATVVASGLAVGFLTGFLGVGGGFLVVPALVIALRMPMTLAIGTSLTVIAVNAASSLVARLPATGLDWQVVVPFTVAAVIGTVVGKRVCDRFSGADLNRAFAVLLVLVGAFVGVESALQLAGATS
ncbi:MAG TPA: sulfite exporter TauE/SafE family protein [Pseudonocardia sp.]|nr:sulfite exporter TauE/SafE family protein [Pseudonocardia sp.]